MALLLKKSNIFKLPSLHPPIMAVNFSFCLTKLTSRRQFGDKAYFEVMHETTTRHPRMPSSILSYSESPPPICLTSSQHVNPRDVRASYSFFTCGCFPHWYEMNTSGETVTCEDKFVNYFFFVWYFCLHAQGRADIEWRLHDNSNNKFIFIFCHDFVFASNLSYKQVWFCFQCVRRVTR